MVEGSPASNIDVIPVDGDPVVTEQLLGEVEAELDDKTLFPMQPLSKVTDTTTLPARAITQLIVTYQNGVTRRCSGTMVGADSVLTAAHCVYNKSRGGFAASIEVIPGRNAATLPSTGRTWARASYCPQEYQDLDPADGKVLYDYGIIRTKLKIGDQVGTLALTTVTTASALNKALRLRGYPDDGDPHGMYTSADTVRTTFSSGFFYHRASTLDGMSGAGVAAGTQVFGVHIGTTPDAANNDGMLITSTVRSKIDDWMSR